jgi:hypothetical protein
MSDIELLEQLYKSRSTKIREQYEDVPKAVSPVVTLSDAENGYLFRYFVQMVTDKRYIIEVDRQQFERFKENPRFNTKKLIWKIVGPKESIRKPNSIVYGVADINREEVIREDLTMPGLRLYIQDYTEFWFSENVV